MFLTPDELRDLTGYVRPSAQIRWLKRNGCPFTIGGDGLPKLLRSAVLAKLGGSISEPRLRLV